jgi:hypothetical protein
LRAASPLGSASLSAIGRSPPRSPRAWRRRDAAGSARGREIEHRRFDADRQARRRGSSHLSPSDSATCSARVGLTAPLRLAEGAAIGTAGGADQRLRHRMRRRADRDGVEAGRREQRDRRAVARGSTSVSGPGQNVARACRPSRSTARSAWPRGIEHVADQRIELRPALGLEDLRTARSLVASPPRP